jgi:hypothetical protein
MHGYAAMVKRKFYISSRQEKAKKQTIPPPPPVTQTCQETPNHYFRQSPVKNMGCQSEFCSCVLLVLVTLCCFYLRVPGRTDPGTLRPLEP